MSRIDLRIDRLVLDGLTLGPGDAQRLGAVIERELSMALAVDGAASSGNAHRVMAPEVALSPDGGVETWGRQIAHSVHRSISPSSGGGNGER